MEICRIVLADDHVMFRHGIKSLFEGVDGLEVVGEAGDGLALLDLVRSLRPDIAIIDISMPNSRGIEATREIKTLFPDVKVLVLTMHKSKEYLYHAISAGAEGYLLKEDADTELFAAISKIRNGDNYISPLLSAGFARDVVQASLRGEQVISSDSLSKREREVLKLIAEGNSNQEIGDLLSISVRTAEHHRANIMKKLGIKDTANLVKYAIRRGYTTITS